MERQLVLLYFVIYKVIALFFIVKLSNSYYIKESKGVVEVYTLKIIQKMLTKK